MVHDGVRDECRRQVAARGLTPSAVAHLTREALGRIDLSSLAPLKALLKRFFSDGPWTIDDDRALSDLVGPGEGWWSFALDEGFGLEFGWRDGAFQVELTPPPTGAQSAGSDAADHDAELEPARLLAETFEQPVVPEATPNPRTIRFVTGPINAGASRWYESAAGVDDARVERLFRAFEDVDNVLVGPDFVAVGLHRPDRWEDLLVPVLRVVAEEFAPVESAPEPASAGLDAAPASQPAPHGARAPLPSGRGLEAAWRDLGRLQLDQPDDVDRILTAASSSKIADRQVAARVLVGADPDIAHAAWDRLLADSSRSVRRATVDAMVDAERPTLRPLLERALRDTDAWTRWKALSGIVGLGIEPSRDAVVSLAADADFRVRLEAASALRPAGRREPGTRAR